MLNAVVDVVLAYRPDKKRKKAEEGRHGQADGSGQRRNWRELGYPAVFCHVSGVCPPESTRLPRKSGAEFGQHAVDQRPNAGP